MSSMTNTVCENGKICNIQLPNEFYQLMEKTGFVENGNVNSTTDKLNYFYFGTTNFAQFEKDPMFIDNKPNRELFKNPFLESKNKVTTKRKTKENYLGIKKATNFKKRDNVVKRDNKKVSRLLSKKDNEIRRNRNPNKYYNDGNNKYNDNNDVNYNRYRYKKNFPTHNSSYKNKSNNYHSKGYRNNNYLAKYNNNNNYNTNYNNNKRDNYKGNNYVENYKQYSHRNNNVGSRNVYRKTCQEEYHRNDGRVTNEMYISNFDLNERNEVYYQEIVSTNRSTNRYVH